MRCVGVYRNVPELSPFPVEVAIHIERGINIVRRAVQVPIIGGEHSLTTEDTEYICLRHGARYVVTAAIVVLGEGYLRSRIKIINVALHAG